MSNLELKKVCLSYNNKKVLNDIDIKVEPGEILLVSGVNGCGKTSLMKVCAGVLEPDSGEVTVCGMHYGEKNIYRHVGYAPWRFGTYDSIKVKEYLQYYAACGGLTGLMARKRIEYLCDMMNLTDRVEEYVNSLSAGTLQRLSLVRCLIHDPELLLLDEPLNCLDPGGRALLTKCVKDRARHGMSVVISSHNLTQMENICTNVCFLKDGKVAMMDSIENVLNDDMDKSMVRIVLADQGQMKLAVGLLRPLEIVKSISCAEAELMVNLSDEKGAFGKLLDIFLENNIATLTFAREERTLEEIFVDYFEVEK